MRALSLVVSITLAIALSGCAKRSLVTNNKTTETAKENSLLFPGEERHFQNLRQLTFDGKNAEAYFSFDNRWLIYQSQGGENQCDQMYVMKTDGTEKRRVSSGQGRVTCGFFVDADKPAEQSRIIYSSTHDHGSACPNPPDLSEGYVWPLHNSYEIYVSDFEGKSLQRLTDNKSYDAEATVSPDGKEILFTSDRGGDLDLYIMSIDGKNVRRLTSTYGYDGGAFFSPDGKQIIYRAYHPTLKKERQQYARLLKKSLFKPSYLELFVMNRDGTNKRRLTDLKAASFAPYMFPNNRRVIFSSNLADPKGRFFDLFAVNTNGGFLEKLTFNRGFDSFPMFSYDGKKVVWASNRNSKDRHEINIFTADWVE